MREEPERHRPGGPPRGAAPGELREGHAGSAADQDVQSSSQGPAEAVSHSSEAPTHAMDPELGGASLDSVTYATKAVLIYECDAEGSAVFPHGGAVVAGYVDGNAEVTAAGL